MLQPLVTTSHSPRAQRCADYSLPKISRWLLALLLVLPCLGAGQAPGPLAPLVLQTATLPFVPKEFYVATVVDERPERSSVAYLLAPAKTTGLLVGQAVDLRGGGLAAIRQFINQSLPRNPALRPITVRLKECRVAETPLAGAPGMVEGRITVALGLEWERSGKTIPLTDYRGAARYRRPAGQFGVVEPTLRQALVEALKYLNTWMNQEAPRSAKLATGLELSFSDYLRTADDDTIFYDPRHPLTWTDFRGTQSKKSEHYAAAVYPSFAYQGLPKVLNGKVHLDVAMKVFVVRSSSWVSAAGRTPDVLDHEQRHFDIVKLVVERFKRKVQSDPLVNVDYYQGNLQYQYLLSFQEMNRLQDQYDAETQANPTGQARWNRIIDNELHAYGVK